VKTKHQATEFAKDTFKAFEPWINVTCCGQWADYINQDGEHKTHPVYLNEKEDLALLGRHNQGETDLYYQGGHRFQPKHFFANCLNAKHIQAMIHGNKHYYTGGRSGKTLCMLDVDAHKPWQTDAEEANKLLFQFLGANYLFHVPSDRGSNNHLKVIYHGARWEDVNKALKDFGDAYQMFLKGHGILTDVEIKGTISLATSKNPDAPFGQLAKLPCYGEWNYQKLAEFEKIRPVSLRWLRQMTAKLQAATDYTKAQTTIAHCRELRGKPAAKVIRASESVSLFTEEEVAVLPKVIKSLKNRAYYCYAMHHAPRKKGVKLTPLDFVYAFIVLDFCARHADKEDRLPHNRIEFIWGWMYEHGHFTRAFDNSRWAAIRDTLVDCQFLDEIDKRYWFNAQGNKQGKPMQFRLKAQYCIEWDEFLDAGEEERVSIREVYPDFIPFLWRPEQVPAPEFDYLAWDEAMVTELLVSGSG
jgi:hypothetical protein